MSAATLSDANLSPNAPPTYLIVMREVLIAQDIAQTIADHDPGAQVIIALTVAEAIAALEPVTELVIAFIADQPARFGQSVLSVAITARGGRVVMLGEDAETTGPNRNWDVLYQPFTTDAVIERLVCNAQGSSWGPSCGPSGRQCFG